jgi:hypothetical protein
MTEATGEVPDRSAAFDRKGTMLAAKTKSATRDEVRIANPPKDRPKNTGQIFPRHGAGGHRSES